VATMTTLKPVDMTSKYIEYIVVALMILLLIGAIAYVIYSQTQIISTPQNITRVAQTQNFELEKRYGGYSTVRQGVKAVWGQFVAKLKTDGPVGGEQIMLINTNVFSSRLTGTLGPFDNGVFEEDRAVRLALQSGVRLLILEIDHPIDSWTPILTIRDNAGYIRSLNNGSIKRVAESIAGRAFSMANDSVPPAVANDPIMVFLYFRDIPNPVKEQAKYIKYIEDVAEELQPLRRILLTTTPSGSYRRQARERDLLFQPITEFMNRCILMCNVDTSMLRNKNTPANRDLDEMVHARVYNLVSESGHGATSDPSESVKPAIVISNPDYWLSIPPNKIADAVTRTKEMFVIAMNHQTEAKKLSKQNLEDMYNVYGVHSIPFIMFDDESYTKLWLTEKYEAESQYRKNSWNIKPKNIRFIPPPPVVTLKQDPRVNTDMGRGAGVPVLR